MISMSDSDRNRDLIIRSCTNIFGFNSKEDLSPLISNTSLEVLKLDDELRDESCLPPLLECWSALVKLKIPLSEAVTYDLLDGVQQLSAIRDLDLFSCYDYVS